MCTYRMIIALGLVGWRTWFVRALVWNQSFLSDSGCSAQIKNELRLDSCSVWAKR